MLLAAMSACAAIGFAAGHFTSSREPVYPIGTPVEQALDSPAPTQNASSTNQRDQITQTKRPGTLAEEHVCGAPTKSGKPCQRRVKGGGYCWQHRGKYDEKAVSRTAP